MMHILRKMWNPAMVVALILAFSAALDAENGEAQRNRMSPENIYQILMSTYLESGGQSDSLMEFLQKEGAFRLRIEAFLRHNQPDSVIAQVRDSVRKTKDKELWKYLIEAYFLKGKTKKAVSELEKLIETYPDDPNVMAFAGRLYSNVDEYDKAISCFRRAIPRLPDSTGLLRALGLTYLLADQPDSAIAYLEKYDSTLVEDDPVTILSIANAYEKKGDFQKAISYYTLYLDQMGGLDPFTSAHLAEIYRKAGQCENAIAIDTALIGVFRLNGSLYKTLAACYDELGQLETAFLYGAAAVRLVPDDAEAHYILARIFYQYGDLDLALEEVKKAVKLDRKNADYRVLEALIYLLKNEPGKAYRVAKKVPDNEKAAWVCYYVELNHKHRPEKALEWIKRAYDISGDLSYGLSYAELLDSTGRHDEADSIMKTLLKEYPDSAVVWKFYASMKYHSDPVAADSAFRIAARLDTTDMTVLNNWAYLLAENDARLDEADSLIDIALSSDSTNPYFLDTKAWVLYKKGDYKNAYNYAVKALSRSPDDPDVNEHLGFILLALGKGEQAVQYFQKALAADPSRTYLKKFISK